VCGWWVADRESAQVDLRETGQRLGPSDWAEITKYGVQLKRREMEWEEREQHDRSRELMAE